MCQSWWMLHNAAEIWQVTLLGKQCAPPSLSRGEENFGVNWDGEYEPLNRLIFGVGMGFKDAVAAQLGIAAEQIEAVEMQIVGPLYEAMAIPAMPVQDAIDLGRYLVETTAGYVLLRLPHAAEDRRRPSRNRRYNQA